MEIFYHGVPGGLQGNTLYPLFSLKEKFPSLFENEIKKYDDHPKRKELPFKKLVSFIAKGAMFFTFHRFTLLLFLKH